MNQSINRRQFLRGDLLGHKAPIRPPWSMNEEHFIKHCTECSDCIAVCPESILVNNGDGYPYVDFQQGECTFCEACADSCQSGALDKHLKPWGLVLNVNNDCLAKNSIVCSVCAEQCEARAIIFKPVLGNVPQMNINRDLCNGCGACIKNCPTASISLLN